MNVLKSVIITLPKGLSSKAPGIISTSELPKSVPKLNFTTSVLTNKSNMDTKKITKHEEIQDESVSFKTDVCVRGKKRRLDHLTWEEKLQRKKLKNRVAAQTSRDRKKAKLDELEETVRRLREQNELLTQECSMLRSQNEVLITETKRLRKEREIKNTEDFVCSMCQSRVSCAVSSLGSTVSSTHPLQQGGTTQLASTLTLTPGATILLKILTIYFLLKNCLVNSKEMIISNDLKNLQKAFCEKLQQKWKQILIEQMNNLPFVNNIMIVSCVGNSQGKYH
ncbi:transcriptional activator hacA isoform X2 [Apis mellifera]|uniref:X-box-binding protein 1 n=1 Tax=Apis mellifera TaxID=7460 RepID=A0A7M7L511_APIME|nr:transcriptional activator hacA isoform X2 [Apis mellifera]|eukprot:XP_026296366.1 transcriptional activator hacA isoform X2 [Apis mellifera]